jgi:hypothetical protein
MAEQNDPNSVTIMVPSKDPEQKEDPTPKHSKGKEPEDKDVPEIVSVVQEVTLTTVRGGPAAQGRARDAC